MMQPAQGTGFNTLDNWGHKTPTQSKRINDRKEKLKGHGPEHVYNTLGYMLKEGSGLNSQPLFHVVRVSQSFSLTIVWYRVAWWNAQWSESGSSIQSNAL